MFDQYRIFYVYPKIVKMDGATPWQWRKKVVIKSANSKKLLSNRYADYIFDALIFLSRLNDLNLQRIQILKQSFANFQAG
jgi:hypothetical protein